VPANAHNACEDIADRGARVNCTVVPRKPIVGARSPGDHGLLACGAALVCDVALQRVCRFIGRASRLRHQAAAALYESLSVQWDKFELADLESTEQSAGAKQQSRRSSLAETGCDESMASAHSEMDSDRPRLAARQ
jgi:hypothetical protein